MIKAYFILVIFVLSTQHIVYTTTGAERERAEELRKEQEINKNYCGYNSPTNFNYCFGQSTPKYDCCAIYQDNRLACLPQASKEFKGKRGDFTVDGTQGFITCRTALKDAAVENQESIIGYSNTFFDHQYCGKRYAARGLADCAPIFPLETRCCYLQSIAYLSANRTKYLRNCINPISTFNNTVLAQTLFDRTDTTLTCLSAGSTTGSYFISESTVITTALRSDMIIFTYGILLAFILILF